MEFVRTETECRSCETVPSDLRNQTTNQVDLLDSSILDEQAWESGRKVTASCVHNSGSIPAVNLGHLQEPLIFLHGGSFGFPDLSDGTAMLAAISFCIFIASSMRSGCPTLTESPSWVYGLGLALGRNREVTISYRASCRP